MYSSYYHSPIGILRISADDKFLKEVAFADTEEPAESSGVTKQGVCQLDEYFSGRRKMFALPMYPEGTDFQKRIWKLLLDIPYGKTISYLNLAMKAGNRRLLRAVGHANGANKLAIIIPCHRVIGSNGKLIGYGGGLWRKKWLLHFESRAAQPELFEFERISKIHENF